MSGGGAVSYIGLVLYEGNMQTVAFHVKSDDVCHDG